MNSKYFYFSHDATMRDDVKVKSLRNRFGIEGYAVYCMLLEELTKSERLTIGMGTLAMEDYAADFGVAVDKLKGIIEFLVVRGLMQLEGDMLVCEKLTERLTGKNPVTSKKLSEAGKRGAEKRWNGKPAIAGTPLPARSTAGTSLLKESADDGSKVSPSSPEMAAASLNSPDGDCSMRITETSEDSSATASQLPVVNRGCMASDGLDGLNGKEEKNIAEENKEKNLTVEDESGARLARRCNVKGQMMDMVSLEEAGKSLIEELLGNSDFTAVTQRVLEKDKLQCVMLARMFVDRQRMTGATLVSTREFRTHFRNWALTASDKILKQQNKSKNTKSNDYQREGGLRVADASAFRKPVDK